MQQKATTVMNHTLKKKLVMKMKQRMSIKKKLVTKGRRVMKKKKPVLP